MPRKPTTLNLPAPFVDEITAVAAAARRSVAFVVRRALGQGPPPDALPPPAGPTAALALTTDEDDPADLVSRTQKAAGARSLDEAATLAWAARRTQFLAWAARERAAAEAERADDLDAELQRAEDPSAGAADLEALLGSVYVRVRALVARHPHLTEAQRKRLVRDPDRVVREAAWRSGDA
jgi:hypothetical protein